MAIRIHDVDAPENATPAQFDIAGNRSPGAVAGKGLTRDVDQAVFEGWAAANPDVAADMQITTEEEIAYWIRPKNAYGYELGLDEEGTAPPPVLPPENVDVPHVTQSGAVLNCTMGNWNGEPTSYAYQWQLNGVNVGTNAANYTIHADEVGQTATCTVTATNAAGSTTAPPSNPLTVVSIE